MDPSSDLSRSVDRGAWQFSLRQCLAAVALAALVCAACGLSELLGWAIGILLTVPIVVASPIRGVRAGLTTGACAGAAAAAIALGMTVPWRVDWDLGLAVDLAFEIILAPLAVSVSIGATLGAATTLVKAGRNGGMVFLLLLIELVVVIYMLLPRVY